MHDDAVAPSRAHLNDEITELVVIRFVKTLYGRIKITLTRAERSNTHLDRHRHINNFSHRRNAIRHELGLVHQAGAESTLLHFV